MYFWNINKLKAQLIERPATELEALPYLVAILLLWMVTMYSNLPTDFGLKFFVNFSVVFSGTLFGTYWLYKVNNTKLNNYFLQRYTILGWVVLIRYIVIFIIPFIALYTLLAELGLGGIDIKSTSWSDVVMNFSSFIAYYWYFGKHLAEVAQKASY